MTDLDAVDERFPVFELEYSDNDADEATSVRSRNGIVFARAAGGGSFRWISLRILSSGTPLKLRYSCRYVRPDVEGLLSAEALAGERCPPEDAAALTQISFTSKVYYRCWVARPGHPGEEVRDPAGTFWHPSGRFCGTTDPGSWITALEVKMPPIFEAWRTAAI